MTYDKRQVGRRVRSLRVDLGMSQEDLARATGISVTTIASYEQGRCGMTLARAYALADAFECTLDFLVCRNRRKEWE